MRCEHWPSQASHYYLASIADGWELPCCVYGHGFPPWLDELLLCFEMPAVYNVSVNTRQVSKQDSEGEGLRLPGVMSWPTYCFHYRHNRWVALTSLTQLLCTSQKRSFHRLEHTSRVLRRFLRLALVPLTGQKEEKKKKFYFLLYSGTKPYQDTALNEECTAKPGVSQLSPCCLPRGSLYFAEKQIQFNSSYSVGDYCCSLCTCTPLFYHQTLKHSLLLFISLTSASTPLCPQETMKACQAEMSADWKISS